MVIKKNKTDDSGLSPSSKKAHEHTDRYALSKNNGESVKYRIRKQEELEAHESIEEYLEQGEDLIGGIEAEVPGVD